MIGVGSYCGASEPTPFLATRSAIRKHRRESSLSTSASTSSGHSRVLPFATATTLLRIAPQSTGTQGMAAIAEHPWLADKKDSAHVRAQTLRKLTRPKALTMPSDRTEVSPPTITINGAVQSSASGQPYYPALGHPRFALAQPRRVITVNGAIAGSLHDIVDTQKRAQVPAQKPKPPSSAVGGRNTSAKRSTISAKRSTISAKRSSISLSSMLPAGGDGRRHINASTSSLGNGSTSSLTRRPIIGLGLTLNPADALVTLQPRRAPKQPKALSPVRSSSCTDAVTGQHEKRDLAWSPLPSTQNPVAIKHQSELLLDDAFKRTSFESLSSSHGSSITGDPRLVSLSNSEQAMPDTPAADNSIAAVSTELGSCSGLLSEPTCAAPVEVTCVLCFERVLVSGKRSHTMRCPGCATSLERPRPRPALQSSEPWSLPSTLRSTKSAR
ncbi:hypothetical protein GGI25_005556 [Coemansia spiralis]|uniref:Uncharacterized protein n=2 Tax=Coemansia TaxID=4863 RepID=A0A9W8G2N4_9FUNG|nr:hypothetical protein EDC05_005623 [Coemansia umbellata]KAJ2622649.1 hypothetical protein GGI26_003095 [Coemansia sp. RSA 1358]KAJ2671283.1 hypothetical protein GGI25_005556 [Coemansia spiralis]